MLEATANSRLSLELLKVCNEQLDEADGATDDSPRALNLRVFIILAAKSMFVTRWTQRRTTEKAPLKRRRPRRGSRCRRRLHSLAELLLDLIIVGKLCAHGGRRRGMIDGDHQRRARGFGSSRPRRWRVGGGRGDDSEDARLRRARDKSGGGEEAR